MLGVSILPVSRLSSGSKWKLGDAVALSVHRALSGPRILPENRSRPINILWKKEWKVHINLLIPNYTTNRCESSELSPVFLKLSLIIVLIYILFYKLTARPFFPIIRSSTSPYKFRQRREVRKVKLSVFLCTMPCHSKITTKRDGFEVSSSYRQVKGVWEKWYNLLRITMGDTHPPRCLIM